MPLFGTTGIRKEFSTYDKEENFFTPSIALRLGLAIGTFIKSGTVVVGRDIRTTAIPIELAITSGLVSNGLPCSIHWNGYHSHIGNVN